MVRVVDSAASLAGVIRVPVDRALHAVGVRVDRMCVYAIALDGDDDGADGRDCDSDQNGEDGGDCDSDDATASDAKPADAASSLVDDDIVVSIERAETVDGLPADATTAVEPTDVVAVATVSTDSPGRDRADSSAGSLVGWAFCRVDSPVRIDECVRPLRFEGAYVWGLFVEPAFRERGVGTALLQALTTVAARDRYPGAFALVEASNERSRRVFEHAGYQPVDEATRVTVRGRCLHANDLLAARTYRTGTSTAGT